MQLSPLGQLGAPSQRWGRASWVSLGPEAPTLRDSEGEMESKSDAGFQSCHSMIFKVQVNFTITAKSRKKE